MLRKWYRGGWFYVCLCAASNMPAAISAGAQAPMADVHVHYNWDQAEVIDAAEAVARMKREHVSLAVVSSTPSHLALELARAWPDGVRAFFSPYITVKHRRTWYLNSQVVAAAEQALTSGHYHGIGELHFMAGRAPDLNNKVFAGLVALAKKHRVPMLIHVDASDPAFFIRICRRHADQDLWLAHAGGIYRPKQIGEILNACPRTWVEFSARDPWRYGGLTDKRRLRDAWRKVILRYPGRLMLGTDPVWRVTRTQSWDQADDGWDYYHRLSEYHRRWLKDLPENIAEKLRWRNAADYFNRHSRNQEAGSSLK